MAPQSRGDFNWARGGREGRGRGGMLLRSAYLSDVSDGGAKHTRNLLKMAVLFGGEIPPDLAKRSLSSNTPQYHLLCTLFLIYSSPSCVCLQLSSL